MVIVRTVFRAILFVIAIGAIVVIFGAGFWAVSNQNEQDIALISIGGGGSVGHSPQNIEEFFLSLYLQMQVDVINTPISDDPSPVPFVVEVGENARTVSNKLLEQNFITDADIFRLFLRYNGLDASVEAGDYILRRNMNMGEIARSLQKASFEEVTVTIFEGWRAEQIAELLSREGIMDGAIFLKTVRKGTGIDHPMLADKPAGYSYEGYLFPDTYRLPVNVAPEALIVRMLDTMEAKISDNPFQLASNQGYSFHELMIIASIVEREAVLPEELPTIASVYINRLNDGMWLQADPTVQYAMGYQTDSGQWWKTPVSLDEYSQVISPYNTYLNEGLPPGPISNPGAAAINAVLQPAQTSYLFFMACGEGRHIFSEDFATHKLNVVTCGGG